MASEQPARAEGMTAGKILAAAAGVFRDNPAAPMEAIAAEAGLSRATLHRHFPTRADLVGALRTRAVDVVSAAFREPSTVEEPTVVRLYTVTRRLLEAKVDWSWLLRDLESEAAADVNPILSDAIEWMAELRTRGYLAPDTDEEWAATVYLTLVRAATVPLRRRDDSVATRSARAVDAFLHGVGAVGVRYLS